MRSSPPVHGRERDEASRSRCSPGRSRSRRRRAPPGRGRSCRFEPIPSMRAPICISRRARSCTCGSEAALWITVEPGVSAAAISAFSVAITEGSSMKKSQACSPSGARELERAARCAPRRRARGRRPGGDRAGGGRSRRRRAAACPRLPKRASSGPASRNEARMRSAARRPPACAEISSAADGDHVLVAPLDLHAEPHEQLDHRLDVADARHVAQHDLLAP